MHQTLEARKNSWWYETDPRARPFAKLPAPAYYATGLAMATGLRRHNVFQLGLHLNRRKAGRIPAAAQGLDEEHARHQPLSVNHGELLFTVEETLLRVDDIQVTHEATGVAAAGDVQGTSRRIDRLLLRLVCLIQHGQAGYVILHFAEGIQNAIAIGRHTGLVASFGELHLCAPCPSCENAFRDVGTDRPERALHVYQLGDIRGLPPAIPKK